ncbi:MAG TPA: UDP-3-O-(3-hydroxymyristoyl)glucosamine N-acyltransferase [Tepidisphaeraceae bacterium]|nr:UDP-3-O-(3-hydroxymyristoyl)glucosamine N-acyltransferase [Tepidisphaeraceae bacterium]
MPLLSEISKLIGSPAPAGADIDITGLATLDEAQPSELSFVGSEQYLPLLQSTKAGAIIVQKRVKLPSTWTRPALMVDDADLSIAKVLRLFAPPVPRPTLGVDAMARVEGSATLGEGVSLGPFVYVGHRARIGSRVAIHAGVYIGDDVVIGDDCEIFPHVTLRERVVLGQRVIIHAGSVLGTDGFGYRWDGKQHQKIPQIGTVIVEDDVEIGSCVCIDRAKFSTTRIGRGTKIDNLVQVGHNVQVGPHCIIVGQAGLAGSSKLGAGVVLGGQTAVRDHISIGDGAMAAACSAIAEDVEAKQVVSGMPALPHRQSLREQAALRRLPDLVVQIRKLQDELDLLKGK